MPYVPKHPPPVAQEQSPFTQWIENELQAIARTFQESEQIKFTVQHAAPERPREGMVAFADGTDWNPSQSRGSFLAALSADQTLGTPDDINKVELDTITDPDGHGWFDGTTNYRYTPQVPGIYLFIMQLSGDAGTASPYGLLYLNGSPQLAGSWYGGAAADSVSHLSVFVPLNGSTDYVELFGYAGTTFNSTNTFMQGYRVSPDGASSKGLYAYVDGIWERL